MAVEQKPLTRLQTQRSVLNTTRAVYKDLKTNIDNLMSSTKRLISTNAFYDLGLSRTATSSDEGVLTATATSTAPTGKYDITVTKLATAQRRVSSEQALGSMTALGLSGTFYLGGMGPGSQSASISGTSSGPVTGVSTSTTIDDSVNELATGTYTIKTRVDGDGNLQFKVYDANGNAVSIGNDYSTSWQDVEANGTYDTGRGLVINFGDSTGETTTTINYSAMGRAVTVEADDTLIDISDKINSAKQPGEGIGAAVIGNQIVLTNNETGAGNRMVYSSWLAENLGFASDLNSESDDLETPQDAEFTVSGLSKTYTSSSNKVSNVIQGLTLNLAAEGTAKITVAGSSDSALSTMNDFISNFNTLTSYLKSKTAVNEGADGTYTRGTLSGDSSFYDLRSNLYDDIVKQITGGAFSNLSEMGITISDDLKLQISDETAFSKAITNNSADVTRLIDKVAQSVYDDIKRFTGDDGALTQGVASFDNEIKEIDSKIEDMNTRLSERYNYFVEQYSEIQATLALLASTYSTLNFYYGTSSSSSSSTTSTSA